MFLLPSFQSGERGGFVGGIGHYQQRHLLTRRLLDGSRARRSDPGSLAFHLSKMRRPRRIAQTIFLVAIGEFQQLLDGSRGLVHVCVRIADFGKALGNAENIEIRWIAIGDLIPSERRRHAGIRQRAN